MFGFSEYIIELTIEAEAIRTTVVPIRILKAPYRHDRHADKNPYRHDRNMRFSCKLNYALFSILIVSFL